MTYADTPNSSPAPDAATSESADEAAGVTAPLDVAQRAGEVSLAEEGRRLASQRDDLIAAGADPRDLLVPLTSIEVTR